MNSRIDNSADKTLFTRCGWQVLVLSTLSVLIFPDTFVSSYWLGQIWLWLITPPLFMLLVIHRHRFAAACSVALVSSSSRRRWQSSPAQARGKRFGKAGLNRNPLRAA